MANKKTYKDFDFPNPTTRSKFLPKISPSNGIQRITYIVDAPYFLKKMIELKSTNYSGYSEEIKTNGDISEEALWNYLHHKELNQENEMHKFRENQLFNLVYTIDQKEKLLLKILRKERFL